MLGFTFEGFEIACNVTMPGTLESSVPIIEEETMGTLGSTEYECSGGAIGIRILEDTVSLRLWRVLGLPNLDLIDGVLIKRSFGILIENGFFSCLYGGTLGILIDAEGHILHHARVLEVAIGLLRRLGGLLNCPPSILPNGSLTLEPEQSVYLA